MLYFAYGSNMDWAQMKERCPSATFVGVAALRDHRIGFTRKSIKRGCGVADALKHLGRDLWGVVYALSDADSAQLDRSEGFEAGRSKNSYWRRDCLVFLDGDASRSLTVCCYFAEPEADPPPPNRSYKSLIVNGARSWGLPDAYVAELERIEAAP